MSKIKVLIQEKFHIQSKGRGIGMYTKLLTNAFEENSVVELVNDKSTADIIHYPFFDLFFFTLPFHFKKNVVVTIHDVIPLLYPDKYKPGFKGFFRFILQRLSLLLAKAVITDSETSKKDIHQYLKVPKEKIFSIPLAANPELTAQPPKKIQATLAEYNITQPYILYVGDINYNKNIPQLIKMIKYLPTSVRLVCVGKNFKPQPIAEWQRIETQLAMSDVTNRVQFIPSIETNATDTLSALYSGALCYVQPSLYEGFGLPVLEAMRCKTPVVASDTPALLEIGGTHVLFAQPKAEAFAQQVKTIMEWSQRTRKNHIDEAYAWSEHYTWKKTADQTIKVYQSVL